MNNVLLINNIKYNSGMLYRTESSLLILININLSIILIAIGTFGKVLHN